MGYLGRQKDDFLLVNRVVQVDLCRRLGWRLMRGQRSMRDMSGVIDINGAGQDSGRRGVKDEALLGDKDGIYESSKCKWNYNLNQGMQSFNWPEEWKMVPSQPEAAATATVASAAVVGMDRVEDDDGWNWNGTGVACTGTSKETVQSRTVGAPGPAQVQGAVHTGGVESAACTSREIVLRSPVFCGRWSEFAGSTPLRFNGQPPQESMESPNWPKRPYVASAGLGRTSYWSNHLDFFTFPGFKYLCRLKKLRRTRGLEEVGGGVVVG
ncbi:hypothetical protein V8F06_006459 [Rhypophila decipiens]